MSSDYNLHAANLSVYTEFWENRVAVTNLRPTQTRVPEVPDQSEFLAKWYDFHRGYRTIKKEDGSEERIAMLGEPFRDVAPGQLPRTLDELRSGRDRSEADQQQHIELHTEAPENVPSLDAELDQMFADAAAEEEAARLSSQQAPPPSPRAGNSYLASTRTAGQVMQAAGSRNREYQDRRIAALRRELLRMRNGIERVISGLRDLGELVPYPVEASIRLSALGVTLDQMGEPLTSSSDRESPAPAVGAVFRDDSLTSVQQRITEAQAHFEQATRFREQSARELNAAQLTFDEARRNREEAAEVLDGAGMDLADHSAQISQLRREQRSAENYFRVFGSREEIERQGQEYVSPIGSMFTRAWERFTVAEEVRRDERTLRQVLHDEQNGPAQDEDSSPAANTVQENTLEEYYSTLRRQDWAQNPSQTADPVAPSGQDSTQDGQYETRPLNRLEHLLRNTPEPERSSIIARMRENGTAQALEEPTPNGIFRLASPRTDYGHMRNRSMRNTPYDLVDNGLDEDDEPDRPAPQGLDVEDSGRPEPKSDEEMTIRLDCKICYTQTADTACLPCGHLVMCQWCSEQHSPAMRHDRTRPRDPANCPVCRKKIKQKVRIYRP